MSEPGAELDAQAGTPGPPAELVAQARQAVARALRQAERMNRSLSAKFDFHLNLDDDEDEEFLFNTGDRGLARRAWDHHLAAEDDQYFFVLTVRHAINARERLSEHGVEVSGIVDAAGLVALRNVYEHWDDPYVGKELKALGRLRDELDGRPQTSSITGFGGRGVVRMKRLEGFDTSTLEQNLKAVLVDIDKLSAGS